MWQKLIHTFYTRRKSLSEGWKTNVGESEIQEVSVQDKYKVWIDEVRYDAVEIDFYIVKTQP